MTGLGKRNLRSARPGVNGKVGCFFSVFRLFWEDTKKTLPVGRVSEFAWTGLLTSREEHFVFLRARVHQVLLELAAASLLN